MYQMDKGANKLEIEFNYGTDEDSVYAAHEYEIFKMPPEVEEKFILGKDSAGSKDKVQKMIRRFKKNT